MKHFYLRHILLCLCLLAGISAKAAYDAKINSIYYKFFGNEASVGHNGENSYYGDVVIPKFVTYNGKIYKVTSIGVYAFNKCSGLTSITIPSSVTKIENSAFQNCSLTSMDIPNSVIIIEPFAFAMCGKLKTVTIGNSVTSIGSAAFSQCNVLSSITIPNSVTSIGSDAFYGTAWYNNQPDGLVYAGRVAYKYKGEVASGTHITIKDGTLGIAEEAFKSCKLTTVTIPNSIINIGSLAFYLSKLTSVTIPNNVTSIGLRAFDYCSNLTSVTIGDGVTCIGNGAFWNCRNLTSITMGKSITSIGALAFSKCENLQKVIVPDIAAWCEIYFESSDANPLLYAHHLYSNETTEVKNLVIPDGVTYIGEHAFYSCKGLTSITIPNTVTTIGDFAFSGCSDMESVSIGNNVASIGLYAFDGTLWYDNQPEGLVYAGNVAYNYKGTIPEGTEIILKEGTKGIAGLAFANCTDLTSISIPESVISVGVNAFLNTTWFNNQPDGLVYAGKVAYQYKGTMPEGTQISIKEGTTEISGSAFRGCSGLASVNIPKSVIRIGGSAFSDCSGLTTVTIPDGVTSINKYTFSNCKGLTSVSFSNNVNRIYNSVFYSSKNVTDVYCLSEKVPVTGSDIGSDYFGSATLYVPKSSVDLYKTTEPWSSFGAVISLETDNFRCIDGIYYSCSGNNAEIIFCDNAYSGTMIIPTTISSEGCTYSVTSISQNAFEDCIGLTSINIPSSVTSIGESAFNGCSNLTSVTVNWTEPLSISSTCFSNSAHAVLYVPKGCRDVYANADNWNLFSSIIEPPHINGDIFEAPIIAGNSTTKATFKVIDSENRYVSIGSGEEASIPDWTSEGVTVPASVKGYDGQTYQVTRIENFAFFSCYEMTSVNIPQGVTSIGEGAFYYCSALESVSLPQDLKHIESNAFAFCENLSKITIPQNVTSIGNGAFVNCDNLTTVTVERKEPVTIDDDCFSNAANAILYVPIGSKNAYKTATGWKNFGQILDGTENLLMADDVEVCRGGQLTLPIILSNEETIRALQFELSLPQGVSVVTDGKGNPLASLTQRASSTHIITGALMPNGNYQFQIMSKTISDDIILGNDGRIATITLKVLLNVVPNDYTVKITDGELSVDGKTMPLLLPETNSKLTVSSILLGDTNNDKRVSVTDISNIIDYILHKDIPGFVWHAANASGDEKISVSDISTIIDIILHKTVFGERQATRIEELNQ